MYSNETAFSKALIAKIIKSGYSVTRIESHDTGNGIPDMFVQGYGLDFWLELKHLDVGQAKQYKINWRPGQQAWHETYYKFHGRKNCVLTVVDMKDGIMIIPMTKVFPNNTVCEPLIVPETEYHSKFNIARLFAMLSNPVIPKDEEVTLRYLLNDYTDKYYRLLPDTDVLDPMGIEHQELDRPPVSLKRLQEIVLMLWEVLESVALNTL